MKSALLLLAGAINSVMASPVAVTETNLVTIANENGTWIGSPPISSLSRRHAECASLPQLAYTDFCTPGDCDCAGNNGCWSYNGHDFQCQCGPYDLGYNNGRDLGDGTWMFDCR